MVYYEYVPTKRRTIIYQTSGKENNDEREYQMQRQAGWGNAFSNWIDYDVGHYGADDFVYFDHNNDYKWERYWLGRKWNNEMQFAKCVSKRNWLEWLQLQMRGSQVLVRSI